MTGAAVITAAACPETPLLGNDGVMPGDSSRRYPPELREQAVRMVVEIGDQHDSEWAAISEVARLLGVGTAETVRKWARTSARADGDQVSGPLSGIRVLDLSRILAAPLTTQLLGDLGAEVIKVERPGAGDDARQYGPPFLGDAADNQSGFYLSANRNKRSITIDHSRPQGRSGLLHG